MKKIILPLLLLSLFCFAGCKEGKKKEPVYEGKKVRIRVDDGFEIEKTVNSVVIANGGYFGGGMWIAPEAVVDDGLFDVIILDDMIRIENSG